MAVMTRGVLIDTGAGGAMRCTKKAIIVRCKATTTTRINTPAVPLFGWVCIIAPFNTASIRRSHRHAQAAALGVGLDCASGFFNVPTNCNKAIQIDHAFVIIELS